MNPRIERRDRPAARIAANGLDITTNVFPKGPDENSRPLVSLVITDEAGIKSDTAELVIDNRDGFEAPPIGSELQIWLGYEPAPAYLGKYRVDGWTKSGAPNVLTVSAKSADLTTAIKAKKLRSWHDTTVAAIVRKIAGEHSLGASVDATIGARAIEHIDQQTESDMGFLSRLARRNGATFKLADGKVIFAKKGSRSHLDGQPKEAVIIRPVDVWSWSLTEGERGGHRSAVAYYHDHTKGKRIGVTAGAGEPRHVDARLYRTKAEAEAAAAATLGDLSRGKREGQLDGPGNPALFAEGLVTLQGFDPDVDGDYFAKSVTHSFTGNGFTTSVTLETEKGEEDGAGG